MKKIILLMLGLVAVSSCSSGGGDTEPVNNTNTAPAVPSLASPSDNLVCTSNSVSFSWAASKDDQNDPVTYQLEVATNSGFSQNLSASSVSGLSKQLTLEKGTLYYWRVKAMDSKSAASGYSPVRSFYTEGEGVTNHLPFAPGIVAPDLNSNKTVGSVNLIWTAVDADASDVLKYDVYFGTANPPTEVLVSNLTTKSFATNVSTSGTYYWKVVVKDNNGGTTIGQVWAFNVN